MVTRENILKLLYFITTTLIVMAPALYNRYPLVYFDSGAYMEMAASLEPSFHRAIGYPILMRISGWLISNWPIVFLQSLLVNGLLYRLCSQLEGGRKTLVHFIIVTTLAFTTSMSWYAAQLMPDIFTLILALTAGTLLLEKSMSWKKVVVYSAILSFGLIAHLSHIPMLLLVVLSLLLFKRWFSIELFRNKLILLSSTLMLAVVFTCSYNMVHDHGFKLSLASNVFMTASIAEMGFLNIYLEENCPNAPEELCEIKDNLPLETGGFLWAGDSPVQSTGADWERLNEEWQPIVSDFLTKPQYLKWFLFGAVKSTVQQLFQIELGSGLQYTYSDGSPPSWPMRTHFAQELNEYLTSVQNKNADDLPLTFFKMVNYLSLFLTLLILGYAIINGQLSKELLLLLFLFTAFYFYNASITAVLANVYERLQCRLLPLFPLIALFILFKSRLKFEPKG